MKFVAYERTLQGTGASRRLRDAHKVPGIVYGAGASAMIELDHNALFFALKKEAFHSSILEMELAGKTQNVLLRDYQMHPFQPTVLHVDFQRVAVFGDELRPAVLRRHDGRLVPRLARPLVGHLEK